MTISLDKEIIEIPCPACGKKIKKPISWFKKDNLCPHIGCGARLVADKTRRKLVAIEKELNKTISGIGGKAINVKIKL